MEYDEDDDEAQVVAPDAGIGQAELFRSYVSFFGRAVGKRRLSIIVVFVLVGSLTSVIAALLPPAYHCEMKLTAVRNQVFEDERSNSLGNARELVKRHDKLVDLAKRAGLVARWDTDRAPVLRLKDTVVRALLGANGMSDADKLSVVVFMLDQRLTIQADDITLTIGVDWPSGETAARIVEAAQQSFLEARHSEEISTIQEKIAILDQHASKLRDEIDTIAEQIGKVREDKASKVTQSLAAKPDAPAALPRRRAARILEEPDEDLPRQREELETKKKAFASLQSERSGRLAEARMKLADAQIKYTPAHPIAVALEETIGRLSFDSAEMSSLKDEIRELESVLKGKTAAARGDAALGAGPSRGPSDSAAKADVLPSEIMKLLDSASTGVDPVATAHLSSAVGDYTQLHEAIRNKRIALDTAQAAFNHRYKVLVPVEVPAKPTKSKAPVIAIAGWIGGLVVAFLVAILAELRSGKMVERWQVHQLQLPILAELRFPAGPKSNE
ncbi:MAG TPA: hypothetical protein VJT73_13190 [Polyangiaceae bacterium]|nr:hypothetical protein [Polyangiaceae bacterium]